MTRRPVFKFDLNRCTGCQACEVACTIANGLPLDRSWREVRTYNELHVPGVEQFHLSMACNHCGDAPCMTHCPAGAYHRDRQTGAVLINADACIGCQYCAWVCPFDALRFAPEKGVMTKCNFCNDRLLRGEAPACVESCPTGALDWAIAEESARAPKGIPGLSTRRTLPALHIVPLHSQRKTPRQNQPFAVLPLARLRDGLKQFITLRHEWPLAVFTMLAAVMVGLYGGFLRGTVMPKWYYFLAAGLGGMLLSASHLGRRSRAWRAVRQLRSSSLSREIVIFGAYLFAATLALLFGDLPTLYDRGVMVLGFLTLLVIDRVYAPVRLPGSTSTYSTQTLITGLLLTAAWQGINFIFLPLLLLRAVIYVARKLRVRSNPVVGVLRLLLMIGGAMRIVRTGADTLGLVALIAGEFIDRLEYYYDIEIPTPSSLMLDDLEKRVSVLRNG